MKTSIVAIITLVLSMALNAQITHEHTYNYSGALTQIDTDEYKYFVMDVPMKQCRIYNVDHSLYKTIGLSVPEGYYLYDIRFVSRKTFNMDEEIELLYTYSKTSMVNAVAVTTYGMKVVNENGNVLLNLNDGGLAEIKECDGAPKLFAYQYIYYENYYLVYTNIYSIGGNGTSGSSMESSPSLRIYPNPAGDMVQVEMQPGDLTSGGQVMISDLSGKMLLDQSYDPGRTRIPVVTGDLVPGTYIMHVTTENGTSVAGKIVKN